MTARCAALRRDSIIGRDFTLNGAVKDERRGAFSMRTGGRSAAGFKVGRRKRRPGAGAGRRRRLPRLAYIFMTRRCLKTPVVVPRRGVRERGRSFSVAPSNHLRRRERRRRRTPTVAAAARRAVDAPDFDGRFHERRAPIFDWIPAPIVSFARSRLGGIIYDRAPASGASLHIITRCQRARGRSALSRQHSAPSARFFPAFRLELLPLSD